MGFETELGRQILTGEHITRFIANTKKLGSEKLTATALRQRQELLKSYWVTFTQRHERLGVEEGYSQSDYAIQDVYTQIEEAYVDALVFLTDLLEERSGAATSKPEEPQRALTTPGRLPENPLPKFSGDYLAWESFRDLFVSMVHQQPGISDATRLQYLKSALTGEAARLISNISVTDANYKGAWESIVNRYDNKRLLMSHHFNQLLSLKAMTNDSASELKRLLDSTAESRRSLENLGRPVQHWDDWFVHLTTQRLEPSLQKDWGNSIQEHSHVPTYEELTRFLANRIVNMDSITPFQPASSRVSGSTAKRSTPIRAHATRAETPVNRPCALCKKAHFIGHCPQYKLMTTPQRREVVMRLKLCTNCLRDHAAAKCPSPNRCFVCNSDHHTTLHLNDASGPVGPGSVSTAHAQTTWNQSTLLATALVRVTASSGHSTVARALLDQGSEATFISENLCQRLRLPRVPVHVPVTGIAATPCGTVKAKVQVQLSAACPVVSTSVAAVAFVMPRLTRMFHPPKIDSRRWSHLEGLPLSDRGPGSRLDLIIGADLYGDILLKGLVKGAPGTPVAQNTIFGWVLSGRLEEPPTSTQSPVSAFHCSVDLTLMDELKKFWEVEEGPPRSRLTPEEQDCEDHFLRTHTRDPNGRFIVRLPRRSDAPLGNSYSTAFRSFLRSEAKRQKDKSLDQAYRDFMREYLSLGHMSLVPPAATPAVVPAAYLPHHAVWKAEGQSRKIRVVFNASARTSTGHTLNDVLLPGPKLQRELSHILLRWRKPAVVFTADIVKMFRQIWVHPEDRPLQCILWRDSPDQELQEFQLNTVTYGTNCAPYLAIRCLLQLAEEGAERFPEAAQVLQSQTYVDDILAGANTLEEARVLKEQLVRLLTAGGFELAKWSSNTPDLAGTSANALSLTDGTIKTLGLQWHPHSDTFRFQVSLDAPSRITKRSVLSCIARLFDPLGWLTPVLITAKLFIQDLWTTKSDWDSALPPPLEESWSRYYSDLQRLDKIRIPRWITLTPNSTWDIHGFCDASQRAYAAAVYLRVTHSDGTLQTHLLLAKSKVAPIKVLSLPRLELCGALLLARLLRELEEPFQGASKVYAWTDSQVVLCWLRAHPSRWKNFVANRTSEIHRMAPTAIWNHVPSGDNAADPASRGIPADRLATEDLWWHGPPWLAQPPSAWPNLTDFSPSSTALEEENPKALRVLLADCHPEPSLQDRYSSLIRLLRVTAWILRFSRNSQLQPSERILGPLTVAEITSAQKVWIRFNQADVFHHDLQRLSKNSPLPKGSPLLPLRPFLDPDGLLRVGGRLQHGAMEYGEKHPYILPAKSNFSRLLAHDAHHRVLHGGNQLTLSHLSRRFWIIRGRQLVRSITRSCVRCIRHAAKVEPPLMGHLPADRITRSRPFQHTGLDYAGPIQLRTTKGRGHKSYKGYIALFVCMATKAIHLEAVSDCTTEGFLAAFKRFCSRRGIPATLSSDQATNFRGAATELQRLLCSASAENRQLSDLLANDGTQWRFIPPHAPHFGGLWEAGVRSVKHHLRRTVGDRTLTFEELSTVLTEIEACLNSRPLTPLSSSPQDLSALTPGHFLVGAPLKTLPEPSLLDVAEPRLNRWQLLRRLSEQFWRRWSREYLQQLQRRTKWNAEAENFRIDDLVLVAEDNLPPAKWCLGRITRLHPGNDGVVRVVTLRTATTELQRPVVKLRRLLVEP